MSETHQRTLRAILTGTAGLLALKNSKGQYEVVNPRFCQFLALGPQEIVGKTDADLFPQDQASLSAREDQAVFDAGIPRRLEQPLAGQNGLAWFEVHRAAILDDEGEPAGILFSAYDITEFKQREQAVRAAEEQVREAQAQAASATEALAARDAELATAQQAAESARESATALQQQLAECQQQLEAVRAEATDRDAALARAQEARAEAAALAGELVEKLRD